MFERSTDRARRVVVLAQEEARLLEHDHVGTGHLLLGVLHEGGGGTASVVVPVLSLERARADVAEAIDHAGDRVRSHLCFSPEAKKALESSLREALGRGHHGHQRRTSTARCHRPEG